MPAAALAKHMRKHQPAAQRKTMVVRKPGRVGLKSQRGEVVRLKIKGRNHLHNLGRNLGTHTVEAEEWAVRALSPCDERIQNGRQIPDGSTTASIVVTSRVITAITSPDGEKPWNLLVATVPLPDVAFLYKAWRTMDVKPKDWTVARYTNLDAGSIGISTNNNTTPYPVEPTIGSVQTGALVKQARMVRTTMKGHTLSLNASSTTNQGMVLAAQYGDLMPKVSNARLTLASEDPVYDSVKESGSVILIENIPETTEHIFQIDPQAVRQSAREGVYLPLKFNNSKSPYTSVQTNNYWNETEGTAKDNLPIQGPLPVMVRYRSANNEREFNEFLFTGPEDTTTHRKPCLASIGVMNTQCGVVYFEGLSGQASIDVKTVNALELTPSETSEWQGFLDEAPEGDLTIQEAVHSAQRKMPSAYPARYNFLGTLFNMVLPMLGPLAQKLVGGLVDRFATKASKAASLA